MILGEFLMVLGEFLMILHNFYSDSLIYQNQSNNITIIQSFHDPIEEDQFTDGALRLHQAIKKEQDKEVIKVAKFAKETEVQRMFYCTHSNLSNIEFFSVKVISSYK